MSDREWRIISSALNIFQIVGNKRSRFQVTAQEPETAEVFLSDIRITPFSECSINLDIGFYSMSTYFNGWEISKASYFFTTPRVQILGLNPSTNRHAIFANVGACTTDDLNGGST
jgi:hypothetical protein